MAGFGTRDGTGSCPVEGLRSWDPSNPCNQRFPCNQGFPCNQRKTDVKTMMMMMMMMMMMTMMRILFNLFVLWYIEHFKIKKFLCHEIESCWRRLLRFNFPACVYFC